MPKLKKPEILPPVKSGDLMKTKQEGLEMAAPLAVLVERLVVEDEAGYQEADFILSKIGAARKTWKERMERIIRPIRQGLDELYGLNRDVDKPLEALEKTTKQKMLDFKVEERRQLREADEQKAREEQRLRNEAAQKEAAAQAAVTPQLRGRLAAQAERLNEQAETIATQETATPVQAARSSERAPEKVRVHDLGLFIQAILAGRIDEDAIIVNQVWLNKQFKDKPDVVAKWPGVEKYEDLQIVRR